MYYIAVFMVFGAIFLLCNYLRIKLVLFLGINLITIWISYVVFVPFVLVSYLGFKKSKKIKNKFKTLLFSPLFLSQLNESVKKPNIVDYGITESELQEYRTRHRIDTKFYSEIMVCGIVIYFVFKSFNNIDEFEFSHLAFCLLFVFFAKIILDIWQVSKDRKWVNYNLLNQYIKDLDNFYAKADRNG